MNLPAKSVTFPAPDGVTTPTSPNTDVTTISSFDPNDSTGISFQYQGKIPVWSPTVSRVVPTATLTNDVTIGATTWKCGLTVTYVALDDNRYSITLTGAIVDGGSTFGCTGTTLGIFSRGDVKQPGTAPRWPIHVHPPAPFGDPFSIKTPTSPNTEVMATPASDANDTTGISFQYQGSIPVWSPTVSRAVATATLTNDLTIGATTWKRGLTVTYVALDDNRYSITLTGAIVDGDMTYRYSGTTLGVFTRSDRGSKVAS
jgi:hypothetical protein